MTNNHNFTKIISMAFPEVNTNHILTSKNDLNTIEIFIFLKISFLPATVFASQNL